MTRVLVTGANGFIGRALVDKLLTRGFDVTAATRGADGAAKFGTSERVRTIAIGDIDGTTDWRAALADSALIVHLAGIAHRAIADDEATVAHYRAVNVDGTAALAAAAARHGAERLLFLSSVKVNGEQTAAGRPFTETDPPAPGDTYGRSKWQAEQALADTARRGGLAFTIIRSPLVYGPGVRGNFASLLRLCDTPLPLPFDAIDNRRSLIARANLIGAVIAALTHPAAANETFLVRDDEDLSTTELVRRLRSALGRPPRLVPFPGASLATIARLTGHGAAAGRLLGSLTVDDGKIHRLLGYKPTVGARQALAETALAHRRKGAG